tara:strand:+ start:205 stop:759 length:555 start_codon:yes stop_codon:yes gene_type:complete
MMKDCRVIFYDLETTGLDSENDKIIEIAGKDNNGEIFSKLINPKVNISNKIEEITGISNNNVKYRNNIEQNRSKIEEWFDFGNKTNYLVAHNGDNFDLKFISPIFDIKCNHLDSLKFFRKLLRQPSYSIKSLCELFNINTKGHHRALNDVIILEQLFNKGLEIYKLKYNLDEVTIEEIYNYTYF